MLASYWIWAHIFLFIYYLAVASAANEPANECSYELDFVQQSEADIFVGCRVNSALYSNDSINGILERLECSADTELENSTFITKYQGGEKNFSRWTKVCLSVQNDVDRVFRYVLTVDSGFTNGYRVYVERTQLPNIRMPKVPIFKVFPQLNLRLSNDFFYPFTCHGYAPSRSLLSIVVLSVLLRT